MKAKYPKRYQPMNLDLAGRVYDEMNKLCQEVKFNSDEHNILIAVRDRVIMGHDQYPSSVARWWVDSGFRQAKKEPTE